MKNINLKDLKILVNDLSNEIYLAQIDKDLGDGLIQSTNKINITQYVINAVMKHAYLSTGKDSKGIEWESKVGTLTFRKKEE